MRFLAEIETRSQGVRAKGGNVHMVDGRAHFVIARSGCGHGLGETDGGRRESIW